MQLDRTGQRIVGVLIEKQLSVPDTYPLSENALVAGCNQTSNRDPVMELLPFQIAGALMALQQQDVVARVDGAGRVAKFRHKLDERLAVQKAELAVLAELLLRGPQAPGALKPRLQRMGVHKSPEEIEALLRGLAERSPPIVEQLSLRPRERDRRWQHRLGDGSEAQETTPPQATATMAGSPPPMPAAEARAAQPDAQRIAALERRIEELERIVQVLQQTTAPPPPPLD